MAGGIHGRGHSWLGGMHGRGHAWWGACMAGRLAWHTVNERVVRILLECILVFQVKAGVKHLFSHTTGQSPDRTDHSA